MRDIDRQLRDHQYRDASEKQSLEATHDRLHEQLSKMLELTPQEKVKQARLAKMHQRMESFVNRLIRTRVEIKQAATRAAFERARSSGGWAKWVSSGAEMQQQMSATKEHSQLILDRAGLKADAIGGLLRSSRWDADERAKLRQMLERAEKQITSALQSISRANGLQVKGYLLDGASMPIGGGLAKGGQTLTRAGANALGRRGLQRAASGLERVAGDKTARVLSRTTPVKKIATSGGTRVTREATGSSEKPVSPFDEPYRD